MLFCSSERLGGYWVRFDTTLNPPMTTSGTMLFASTARSKVLRNAASWASFSLTAGFKDVYARPSIELDTFCAEDSTRRLALKRSTSSLTSSSFLGIFCSCVTFPPAVLIFARTVAARAFCFSVPLLTLWDSHGLQYLETASRQAASIHAALSNARNES